MKKIIMTLLVSLLTTITVNAQTTAADTISLFTPCIDFDKSFHEVKDWMAERNLQPSIEYIGWNMEFNDRNSKTKILYTFALLDDKKLNNVSVTYSVTNLDSQLKDLIDKVQKQYNVTLTKEGEHYSGVFNVNNQKTEVVVLINQFDDKSFITVGFGRPIEVM